MTFDFEYENRWSRDLGNLLLPSKKIMEIFTQLPMPLVPFFNQINIFRVSNVENSNGFHWINWWTNMKMTRQICHVPVFGCHCRNALVWWHSFSFLKSTIVRYFVRSTTNLLSVVFQLESKGEVPRGVRNSKVRRQDKFGRDWSRH